jgi:hypothetical protein
MSIPAGTPMGNETRKQILPAEAPAGVGFLGPAYDPVDELLLPHQIGVREEGSMSATIDAVKAVAYYGDMIGFGAASNPLTKSMGTKPTPLGVNYFARTGFTCDNGAEMYRYVQGIPNGNAVGKRAREAMEGAGFPALRGFAPGIMEDVQEAVNPGPMLGALFGSGYPKCKEIEAEVGSAAGSLYNAEGVPLVDDVASAYMRGGKWYQKRWVLDRNIKKGEWECARKLYRVEGGRDVALAAPVDPCAGGGASAPEGFASYAQTATSATTIAVGILGIIYFLTVGRQ